MRTILCQNGYRHIVSLKQCCLGRRGTKAFVGACYKPSSYGKIIHCSPAKKEISNSQTISADRRLLIIQLPGLPKPSSSDECPMLKAIPSYLVRQPYSLSLRSPRAMGLSDPWHMVA
jgi:hypothetical protein